MNSYLFILIYFNNVATYTYNLYIKRHVSIINATVHISAYIVTRFLREKMQNKSYSSAIYLGGLGLGWVRVVLRVGSGITPKG